MHDKLKLLLDQLKYDSNNYTYFKDGNLRINIDSKSGLHTFCFEVSSVIPVDAYVELESRLKQRFKGYNIDILFKCENIDYLNDYFCYVLDLYKDEQPLLQMFKDNKVSFNDSVLSVEVANIAEKMKINGISDSIVKYFKKFGFGNIRFEVVVNTDLNNEIVEEINNEINKEVVIREPEPVPPVEEKKRFVPKDYKRPPLIIDKDNPDVVIGRVIEDKPIRMDQIGGEENNVVVDAYMYADADIIETKTDLKIITLKLTDNTDSIYAKIFVNDEEEFKAIKGHLKPGSWFRFKGNLKDDKYAHELTFQIRDMNVIEHKEEEIIDDAEVKRVELHAHTMMSQMDGLVDAKSLVKQAKKWGHKAIAITDHNGCQAFPDVYHMICDMNKGVENEEDKFKAIYGTEITMIDDSVNIVVRPDDRDLMSSTYVVFDTETTGFNAAGGDQMIEIGAVKICNGEIVDRFDELINPNRPLPQKIIDLTLITDEMLADKDTEENVTKRFIEWTGDLPMVAHNAKFDISFLEMAYQKYNLGKFTNTVIDTLELSRTLDNTFARHGLSALVKRYDVEWDEDAHHRADYDAQGTALVFHKMLKKLVDRNFEKISDLDKLVDKSEIHKYGRAHHINILTLNKTGLKNLFKIISLANTIYLYKTPRILRSEIEKYREGLLIGSGCYESEIFTEARSKSDEELTNLIKFYDYVEVQPPECYDHLIQSSDFGNEAEVLDNIRKVVRVTEESGKIIVATGDVHHLRKEDKIYREIIVNQKVPGGGRHPLARSGITNIPSMHFRTTREMLEAFEFLGSEKAFEIVVTNTNKIASMVEILEVIIETGGVPFSPRVKGEDGEYLDCPRVVTDLVYDKASSWYGDPLPYNIEERIAKELYGDAVLNSIKYNLKDSGLSDSDMEVESFKQLHEVILKGIDAVKDLVRENVRVTSEEPLEGDALEKKLKKTLGGIIGGGFDPIYLIAQRLVKHSNDDGFLVGSRGSVGSSFVATMMGITEVNPLPAHYRCDKCKCSIFQDDEGNELGATYSSGFDLPNHDCPNCHTPMIKDGQDMPFATFLGFNADKVPDIDLNFSDLNQASAHEYTKVLFGVDNVYRAGTIGTVADKTAFGFVKGYCEDHNIVMRNAEIERLAMGCTGVKRTTGQHPGGIVVIPDYMDVFDFTPFQFPADDPTSAWRTTHFDYHAIDQDVLKLDILGHSDPTQLRMIQVATGMDVTTVPLDDKATMGIFLSPEPLGVTREQIMCETGTLGIPEFGTKFTLQMLSDTKPTTFAELIKISGLSHGTDVWLGNAQELIRNNVVPFSQVIGCRDDIMVYLMYNGLPPIKAFKIMEFVRKGRASKPKDHDQWVEYEQTMRDAGIADWFIDSCAKIKYMFPKAHAAAYVISAFRIAWYKVHMPVYYYASWLTSKATDFDVESMIKGYDAIRMRLLDIMNKGNEATNKENGIYESLHVCLEATARGIKFLNVDLYESEATTFKVKNDTEIYPPFNSIDGLGDTVAKNIVAEREKREFISIEEVQSRAKISQTLMDKMKEMGIFDGMDESSQLSLF